YLSIIQQTSEQQDLMGKFKANKSNNHQIAYETAKEYMRRYPGETNEDAEYMRKWVIAYEKVMEKKERERAELERVEREKAEREKAEREKTERERIEREKAERERLERELAEKRAKEAKEAKESSDRRIKEQNILEPLNEIHNFEVGIKSIAITPKGD